MKEGCYTNEAREHECGDLTHVLWMYVNENIYSCVPHLYFIYLFIVIIVVHSQNLRSRVRAGHTSAVYVFHLSNTNIDLKL